MNHPELIASFSVPKYLVPSQYHVNNWNRSALIKMLYSKKDSNNAFASGKFGVWETTDGGKTFHQFMDGYPSSPYYFKTNDIYLLERDSTEVLFAATNGGLFYSKLNEELWKHIPLNEKIERIEKIMKIDSNLIVFTESNAYKANLSEGIYNFKQIELKRDDAERRVTLVDLFFHLHDGRALGLPGKLLFDAVGLIIIFLSISAFYIWYFPKIFRRKRKKNMHLKGNEKRTYRFNFKYHRKLGIWAAVVVLIISGTAFFMRPPMLIFIADGSIDAKYYPGFLPDNLWHEKIQNVLYDSVDEKIMIQTSDGIFTAKSDFSTNFENDSLNVPLFVMGATVFEPYGFGGYLIGSFNGLFHLERATGKPINMLTGNEAEKTSNIRPAKKMITGYFKTPQGEEFITAHAQGLLPIGDSELNGRFEMPKEMLSGYRMPLWNYLFEIHNGRFFRGIIGNFYLLIVPLGSLLFFIITITGIYDWFFIRKRKQQKINL